MTALFIILGILFFFAVLLACPVSIQASFHEELSARVGYLFFHYTIAPKPAVEEKQEQEAPTPEEKPKENRLKELLRKKGLSGFLEIFHEVAQIASETARRLFSHLVVSHFQLKITVAGQDAAQIALNYGYVCGAVGSAAGLLLGNVKCKSYRISVNPDFQSEQSRVSFDAKARISLLFLLSTALRAFFRSLKVIKSLKTIHNME